MATGGLLAIFAHPDDEGFDFAGTMAHYAEKGLPVTVVCATRGEVGEISPGTGATPETLPQFREQELRDAMAILDVQDVRFLDFRDSGMVGTDDNNNPAALMNARAESVIEPIVRIIRERRPDVIVTWDESGGYGHPDHIAVHRHVTAAFSAAADASQYADAGDPWKARALFYTVVPMEAFQELMDAMRTEGESMNVAEDDSAMAELPRVEPNCIIDVDRFFDRKMEAMAAHRTQMNDMRPILAVPMDIRRRFFGREYFYRAAPPLPDGDKIDDLFARLD